MVSETLKIGDGFKVNTVTLYGGFARVNGMFMRSVDAVSGLNVSLSFDVSLEEGKQLTPDVVYDFSLTPRTPDTVPEVQPASVAKTVTNKK